MTSGAVPLLSVEGLDVAYGDFQVLWQAAMHVGEGEIVAILGPSVVEGRREGRPLVRIGAPRRTQPSGRLRQAVADIVLVVSRDALKAANGDRLLAQLVFNAAAAACRPRGPSRARS